MIVFKKAIGTGPRGVRRHAVRFRVFGMSYVCFNQVRSQMGDGKKHHLKFFGVGHLSPRISGT